MEDLRLRNAYLKKENDTLCICSFCCSVTATIVIIMLVTIISGMVIYLIVPTANHVHLNNHGNSTDTEQVTNIGMCSSLDIFFTAEQNEHNDDLQVQIDGYVDDVYIESLRCSSACTMFLESSPSIFASDKSFKYIISANHNAYVDCYLYNPCTDWLFGFEFTGVMVFIATLVIVMSILIAIAIYYRKTIWKSCNTMVELQVEPEANV